MAGWAAAMIFAIGMSNNKHSAFTLVELLIVMTVIVVVLGIVFPSLKGFFHGRNLENEAGRFLSLTRFGRSRAISEGVPIELWINPNQARYGLQDVSGYGGKATDSEVYTVADYVKMNVSPPTSLLTHSNMWTPLPGQTGATLKIRFQPDGFISDNSPQNIYFQETDARDQIWLAENSTHSRYEIQTGLPPGLRR